MKFKRILSFIICFAFALSVFPQIAFANGTTVPEQQRQVYLHVQGEEYKKPPADNPPGRTTVYMGEKADVYLAVDNPNKGDFDNNYEHTYEREQDRYLEPAYDMNGYRVKISFDRNYLKLAEDFNYGILGSSSENSPKPVDYKYPSNVYPQREGISGTDYVVRSDVKEIPSEYTKEGKYDVIKLLVFFQGSYLPPKPENIDWYDILKLPLTPVQTGYTKVFIDVEGLTNYNDRLQLFAKDVSGNREEQTFDLNVLHNGVMEIDIRDRNRPKPPMAYPEDRISTEPFEVTLDCQEHINDEPCCDIYYYLNGDIDNAKPYTWSANPAETEKINISSTSTISCYSVRKNDKTKISETVDYKYTIVPPMPYLFDESETLIPNNYKEDNSYNVYAAVGNTYADEIPGHYSVYYTYANLDETAEFDNGNLANAETKWARLENNNAKIKIDKNRIVRLITVGKNEKSEIAEYNLGITSVPSTNTVKAPVFAPESAQFTKTTDSVTIYCADSFFESIGMTTKTNTDDYTLLYTTDGSDPRTHGTPADLQTDMVPVPVKSNMEIKAVVKQGENYSDVITHRYYIKTDKPVRPLVISAESSAAGKTAFKFAHMPDGITIYYTTGDANTYLEAPEIIDDNIYTKGQVLEIEDNKQIKAIAVNDKYGVKSDVSVFTTDELPKASENAPDFVSDCGYYTKNDATLEINQNAAASDYSLWYRSNALSQDYAYTTGFGKVDETISYRAYNRNNASGDMEPPAFCYYIIETENFASGAVDILPPYDKEVICTEDLGTGEYLKGIRLYSAREASTGAKINYKYSYTLVDGNRLTYIPESNVKEFDEPIRVHDKFYDIDITAWLVDETYGNKISEEYKFHIDFIAIPKAVQSDKSYTIKNDYPTDDNTIIYYTLDKTNPADSTNADRKVYNNETFNVREYPTVKTVYFRACGICTDCNAGNKIACANGIYGRVGTYSFSVSTGGSYGGGGGGGTIDKTRKYTKDIFGTEHPTHIGYINGYPDGSVQPDGNITREEIAAILYRVKYKAYDEPFIATGKIFPDVSASRWSVSEIEFMTNKGVIYGYPDGEFKPSRNLTRAEFAALIRRFTGLTKPRNENIYPDLEETHWAYEDIMILTEAGLLQGYEDGTIRPQREISRAEVMTVVNKILGRCPDESYVKGLDFNPFNDLNKDTWHYVTVLEATITHDYYLNSKETLEIKWENWK